MPLFSGASPRPILAGEPFPPVSAATPGDGIALLTRELDTARLIEGYGLGYFPWPPRIAGWMPWWSPDPRAVLLPGELRVGRTLRRSLRRSPWLLTHDRAFAAVLDGCAAPRPGRDSTWLDASLRAQYCALHAEGWAHSVEVWHDERLVGGLFGVAIGTAFCGDSMFSAESDASKAALLYLCRKLARHPLALVDCQTPSAHLQRLGARLLPRSEFLARLAAAWIRSDPLRAPCAAPCPASALLGG